MVGSSLRARAAYATAVILSDSEESAVTRVKSKPKSRSFAIAQDDRVFLPRDFLKGGFFVHPQKQKKKKISLAPLLQRWE
jgi:hypothetical protein